eukprot:3932455-Rhodomonas_salina.2
MMPHRAPLEGKTHMASSDTTRAGCTHCDRRGAMSSREKKHTRPSADATTRRVGSQGAASYVNTACASPRMSSGIAAVATSVAV